MNPQKKDRPEKMTIRLPVFAGLSFSHHLLLQDPTGQVSSRRGASRGTRGGGKVLLGVIVKTTDDCNAISNTLSWESADELFLKLDNPQWWTDSLALSEDSVSLIIRLGYWDMDGSAGDEKAPNSCDLAYGSFSEVGTVWNVPSLPTGTVGVRGTRHVRKLSCFYCGSAGTGLGGFGKGLVV